MTDLPKKTAKVNRLKEIFENAATILIIADGENVKQSNINNKPNPLSSTHFVTFSTCLCFLNVAIYFQLLNFRTVKKTQIAPRLAPSQEYIKPFNKPYAALLAITKTNSGKNGKNASIKGNNKPGKGPRLSYFSNNSIT